MPNDDEEVYGPMKPLKGASILHMTVHTAVLIETGVRYVFNFY